MTTGVLGGGVIFVVAALLWAAVLVPGWMRRREFKSAEQNAVRLQRTLRALAETAEIPDEVRVEATARDALAQERILKVEQRRQEAERKAKLSEARSAQVRAEMRAQQMKRKQTALVRAAKLRRPWVRRVRALSALVFVLSVVGALVGVGLGIAGLGYALSLSSVAVAVAGLGSLVLLAPGRVRLREIDAEHVVELERAPRTVAAPATEAEDRAAAAHAAAQAAAAARIDRARAMARARAERPAPAMQNQQQSMLLAAASHTEPSNAAAERLRQMGVVTDTEDGMLDLDQVLRNRRAG